MYQCHRLSLCTPQEILNFFAHHQIAQSFVIVYQYTFISACERAIRGTSVSTLSVCGGQGLKVASNELWFSLLEMVIAARSGVALQVPAPHSINQVYFCGRRALPAPLGNVGVG